MIKKLKHINNKPLFFLIALLVIGFIGGTIALFTNYASFNNKFDVTKYNVYIDEKFYNKFGTKEVNLKNDGSADVLIRVNYNERWSKEIEGEIINLNNMINGTNLVTKTWTSEFSNNFTYHDGWYYYNKKLKGKSQIQILTKIALNQTIINNSLYKSEYNNADYELDFNLESVQASENAAKTIWGYDVTFNGDGVTWKF